MSATRIEWTEPTWNPVTGCTKISPGCQHGYAEAMARRLQAMGAAGYARGFGLTLHEDRLDQPLGRTKPTVYFTNSMSDLFHEDVPDAFIERVLAVTHRTPQHTYPILTKRAKRLPAFFASRPVPANVGLGVTVEDRRYGLPRIDRLRQVPARVRCFKPWGAWGPDGVRRDQKANGRVLAGRLWDERPEIAGALL